MKKNKRGLAKKKTDRNTVLKAVGGAVETELHFETQWEAIAWMRDQLWKRGLEVNPIHKGFDDKVWLRHSERHKFDTKYYTTKDATNG